MIVFIAAGTLFASGVYQSVYEELALQPGNPFTGKTPGEIALIGGLGASFMSIGAPYATSWTRQFSPRIVIAVGGFAFGLASVIASFGTRLWHFQLTQGLLFGLGICLAFMPAVTVPPTWYASRRALAMGIITSGTGIGGLVWAPALQALIDTTGYRNSLRISGGITGIALILASFAIDWDPITKARMREAKLLEKRTWYRQMWAVSIVDWRVAKSRKFAAQALAGAAQAAAYYTPVFFLSSMAKTYGFSAVEGANFIAISNACNAISKILAGFIADRYGRLRVLLVLTIMTTTAIFVFMLPATLVQDRHTGQALFITSVITYGLFASPYVALFPASLVDLFGAKEFAIVNGALYMARGLGTLAGYPIAGAIVRRQPGGDQDPSVYWGVSVLVGLLMMIATCSTGWIIVEARRVNRATV